MSLEIILRKPLGLRLPIGFPLVPFLNGIIYSLLYNRKYALLFYKSIPSPSPRYLLFSNIRYIVNSLDDNDCKNTSGNLISL